MTATELWRASRVETCRSCQATAAWPCLRHVTEYVLALLNGEGESDDLGED